MTRMPSAARLQELIDRQDILDCLARICRGTDLFVSGFHGDATIQSGSFSGGPDAIYAGGAAAHAENTQFTLHCLSSHACEIAGDSGRGWGRSIARASGRGMGTSTRVAANTPGWAIGWQGNRRVACVPKPRKSEPGERSFRWSEAPLGSGSRPWANAIPGWHR